MSLIFGFLFIIFGIFGLYQVSAKQITKTRSSQWAFLAHTPRFTRFISLLFLLAAIFLLIRHSGLSIGFISFWIFASPIIFIFILYINELKVTQK